MGEGRRGGRKKGGAGNNVELNKSIKKLKKELSLTIKTFIITSFYIRL